MKHAANFVIVIAAIILALVYGKSLLIPFVFAVLLWFLTREMRFLLDKVSFIKTNFPSWLKGVLVFAIMILGIGSISDILSSSINTISNSYEDYQPNIAIILNKLGEFLHVNLLDAVQSAIGNFNFGTILRSVFNALSGILGNTFMIIIYALFIFLEESSFKKKIEKVFVKKEQYTQFTNTLFKIEQSISDYLRLKTFVSLITGGLSYMVLSLVGIDSPLFWAFLIFLLNYIPTIGSLIATVFPAVFSLIQFGEFTPFIIVLLTVGAVQLVVGNIIEPRIMGKSLNLSPLVTLLALGFWGNIWGITGMILSVPITVIMVIVFAQIPSMRIVAMLLSENGEID